MDNEKKFYATKWDSSQAPQGKCIICTNFENCGAINKPKCKQFTAKMSACAEKLDKMAEEINVLKRDKILIELKSIWNFAL